MSELEAETETGTENLAGAEEASGVAESQPANMETSEQLDSGAGGELSQVAEELATAEGAGAAGPEEAEAAEAAEAGAAAEEGGDPGMLGNDDYQACVAYQTEAESREPSGEGLDPQEEQPQEAAGQPQEEGANLTKRKKKEGQPSVAVDRVMALEFAITKSGGTVVRPGPQPGEDALLPGELGLPYMSSSEFLSFPRGGGQRQTSGRSSRSSRSEKETFGLKKVDLLQSSLEADRERYQRSMEAMQLKTSSLRLSQMRFCKARPHTEEEDLEDEEVEDEEWHRLMEEEEAREEELCRMFPSVRKSIEARKSMRDNTRKSRISIQHMSGLKFIVKEWCVKACERTEQYLAQLE